MNYSLAGFLFAKKTANRLEGKRFQYQNSYIRLPDERERFLKNMRLLRVALCRKGGSVFPDT